MKVLFIEWVCTVHFWIWKFSILCTVMAMRMVRDRGMRNMPLTVMNVRDWRFEKSFCRITGILVDCVGRGNITAVTCHFPGYPYGYHLQTWVKHCLHTLSTLMATTWSWGEKSSGCLGQCRGRCCSSDVVLMVSWFSYVGCYLFLELGVIIIHYIGINFDLVWVFFA